MFGRSEAKLVDCHSEAIAFFNSVRTPAALLLGSSLAAVYCFGGEWTRARKTPLERGVYLIYHALSWVALLLSLNVVVTATATGNALLLGSANPMAESTAVFLKREFAFEFATTRLSFFLSLFAFIQSIALRTVIVFDLLAKDRKLYGAVVLLATASLNFHVISLVNQKLVDYPNLTIMVLDMVRLYIRRAFLSNYLCELLSASTLLASLGLAALVLWRGPIQDHLKDK